MGEQLHRPFDIPLFGGSQHGPVIFLGQFAQAHGLQVEAQEAFFLVQPVFHQIQQTFIRCLAVKRHVKEAIEPADFAVIVLRFQRVDVAGSLFQIRDFKQRDRQAQGFGLQQDAQGVGFRRIALHQRRDHRAFMGNHVQQRLGFELAQGFAHRHAADTEKIGQVLLTQGNTARQAAIENGRAQGLFDHRACQVSGNRAVNLDTAEGVGLLCHYCAP
ncbi:hypothetical protein D3C85_962900 [compost metagenome]